MLPAGMLAVPADGLERSISQPDGKWVTICQYGDEHLHFMMTLDGFLVMENEEGGICYANYKDRKISSTDILAHDLNQRTKEEKMYLAERLCVGYEDIVLDSLRMQHLHLLYDANARRNLKIQRVLGGLTTYTGSRKGLVILVNFANLEMSSQTASQDYNRMFNEPGYADNSHVGSVHDYFSDQSYGLFDLTFDVVGPVTVSRNYGYYGSDSMSGYNDINVSEMIVEACRLVDEYVDYRNYDWDADGEVDQVYIIYAGYGQATGGAKNTIWPHESYLSESLTLDNVRISQYACSNELYGSIGTQHTLMGIGTACHEFSHCLGLPDLYDTNYSGAFGMSYWGLMDRGSYNGPKGIGEVPCGYTAFERWFTGWLDFTDIEKSQKIEGLPCLEAQPVAYRIVNDGNNNEYYTLENRQPDKWFSYVAQHNGLHGLLVTHIDYNLNAWSTNKVNSMPTHQRMSPVVADNSYGKSYANLAGDLFPGAQNVTELTNTSHLDYGGTLFNENYDGSYHMNKSILSIQEAEGAISFDVIFYDELPTPVALMPSDITRNSFRALWSAGAAESFTLELELIKSLKPYIREATLIENILDTEYIVSDIDAMYCNYRVRANKGNLHTEWSNMVSVSMDDYDGISGLRVQEIPSATLYNLNGMNLIQPRKSEVYIKNNKKYLSK